MSEGEESVRRKRWNVRGAFLNKMSLFVAPRPYQVSVKVSHCSFFLYFTRDSGFNAAPVVLSVGAVTPGCELKTSQTHSNLFPIFFWQICLMHFLHNSTLCIKHTKRSTKAPWIQWKEAVCLTSTAEYQNHMLVDKKQIYQHFIPR